jgi:CheY-like chemotaxis protein
VNANRSYQPRVLVAEDDGDMRRLLVQALRRGGYDASDAGDGLSLLALLREQAALGQQVDLVITDIRMPGCTGLQLLERLRSAGDNVRVILMTAFGDEDVRDEAKHYGVLLFDKPFRVDDLLDAVTRLLG